MIDFDFECCSSREHSPDTDMIADMMAQEIPEDVAKKRMALALSSMLIPLSLAAMVAQLGRPPLWSEIMLEALKLSGAFGIIFWLL